jgi:LuxR family transcriptional regulator, maltose regulon positive regulatory protein
MTKSIPTVRKDVLHLDTPAPAIRLDTPAWFAWLEEPTTTCFSYGLFNRSQGYIDGFITLRKERRQRGALYWTAYRRLDRRLRKIYIGRSTQLTHARLEEIATLLRARDGPSLFSCPLYTLSTLFTVNHPC